MPETPATAALALATDEPALPVYPALLPAAQSFSDPDLNFQVIQYARFAVPVARAELGFDAIYAPAWPTWLAAQELRQRTGQPLVLHVASLAARPEESLDTATGWIAELQRQALRRANLILTETPALAERVRRELHLPPARCSPSRPAILQPLPRRCTRSRRVWWPARVNFADNDGI
ncbi:glycosyltransferase [Hymenobacter sp. BRD67]|uniref:glycosyltransferase n=1 Tax=Hymenobacter sp. BRD67 TaxID=2675877 RepID=UPI0020B87CF3|nr:glycosyltransferase [Hymenobacter sp. BRD67]